MTIKSLNLLNHYRTSLTAKIFYLFAVLIIIIYLIFLLFFVYYQSKTLKQNILHEGKQLVNILAYNARLGVFAENVDLLKDPVEGIMQNREVILVQVFTSEGNELIIQKRPGEKPFKAPGDRWFKRHKKTIETINKSRSSFYFETGGKIEFWAPVISNTNYYMDETLFFRKDLSRAKDSLTGFVRIIFTKELLHKTFQDILLKSILIPVFFMIPCWFIIYILLRGITRPLNRLTDGVKTIETGSLPEKISFVRTGDEIGRLATAFNNMAESLKKKEVEKQHLEEQLRHSQKMEAIGTFAGGIAHDFNNVLTGIIGFGQILQTTINEDALLKSHVQQILKSAKKGANLVQSLLTFGRKQILNPEPVNANGIIENIRGLLSRIIGEDIELHTVLSEKPLIVMADSGQIEQVLLNLAINARDAIADKGSITINIKSVKGSERFTSSSGPEKSGFALICFSDTGKGMDDYTKERAFDPFFTTKGVGEGTGLGLSMVYGIIKQHNGYIDISSKPGKGTTFEIYLPLSMEPVKEKKSAPVPIPEHGTETVLIAEDDENVSAYLVSILEQYGYKVIKAKDGKDAIKKFTENKDAIKLLILDVIMPEKNGKEVYNEIKRMNPEVKAIFISGYTADIVYKKNLLEEGLDFLPKPILTHKLLSRIRELLEG